MIRLCPQNLVCLVGTAFMMAGLWACSDSKSVAGGVTDIGNSVASGVVVTEANQPVAHARVVAYYDSWDKTTIEDSVETVADENGVFSLSFDSTRSVVFYAESGLESGLTRMRNAAVVVGRARRLEGSLAGMNSGFMRIVGSNGMVAVDESGSFAFDAIPVGEISLVYVDGNQSQARIDFVTASAGDTLKIPALEELEQNDGWLTISDYRYYGGMAFGGIVVMVPEGVVVPKAPVPQDTVPQDTTVTDTTSKDTAATDTSVADTLEELDIDITLHLDSGVVLIEKDTTHVTDVDYVEGISGRAIQLKQGQFIELGTLDPSAGDFTLSLWTKWYGPNGNHQILFCQRAYWSDSTSRFQWHFEANTGRFMAMKSLPKIPYAVVFCDSSAVPLNKWSHLALVSKDRVLTMYVNGDAVEIVRDSTEYGDIPLGGFIPNDLLTAVPFRIGGDEIEVETWNGAIDEIKIESTARSAEWIKAQYEKLAK